jgi:transcriptional regulator with XRE-family HTH domain
MKKIPPRKLAYEINQIKQEKGWTIPQVCYHFKIAPATLWRWQKGFHGPTVESLFRCHTIIEEHKKKKTDAEAKENEKNDSKKKAK